MGGSQAPSPMQAFIAAMLQPTHFDLAPSINIPGQSVPGMPGIQGPRISPIPYIPPPVVSEPVPSVGGGDMGGGGGDSGGFGVGGALPDSIAQMLIQDSNQPKPLGASAFAGVKTSGSAQGTGEDPSTFSRLIDVLSRPAYAVGNEYNNFISQIKQANQPNGSNGNFLGYTENLASHLFDFAKNYPSAAWSGLSGQNKTMPGDALANAGILPKSGWGGGLSQFAVNVLADPTTYIPIGGPAKALGKVLLGGDLGRLVEQGAKGAKAAEASGNVINPSAIFSPSASKSIASSIPTPVPTPSASTLAEEIMHNNPEAFAKVVPQNIMNLPPVPPALSSIIHQTVERSIPADRVLTPNDQVLLFQKINKLVGITGMDKTNPEQFNGMLHSAVHDAFAHVDALGAKPQMWNGTHGSISDLMAQMGDKFKPEMLKQFANPTGVLHPDLFNAIQALQVKAALKDTPLAKAAMDTAAQHLFGANMADIPQSGINSALKDIPSKAADAVKNAGGSTATGNSVHDAVKSMFDKAKGPAQAAYDTHGPTMSAGDRGPLRDAVTHSLGKEGIPVESLLKKGTKSFTDNTAFTRIAARMATHFGQKDLRPEALRALGSAQAAAEKRGAMWGQAFKGVSKDEASTAWRAAQGNYSHDLLTPKAAHLADQISNGMHAFFSSSMLSDAAQKYNTVTSRSGMLMSDLNKQLKRYKIGFKFTNKAKVPIGDEGQFANYSKGTDWMKSWESAKTDDPQKFIFGMQSAAEQVSRKIAMLDDVAAKFGSRNMGGAYRYTVDNPYLKGVFFDQNHAKQIHTMLQHFENLYDPGNPLLRSLEHGTNIWKSAVTINRPGFHVRNFIGDSWFNWIGGVNNPVRYRQAMKVILGQRARYGVQNAEDLMGKAPVEQTNRVIITDKAGRSYTQDQLYHGAFNRGILPGAHHAGQVDISRDLPSKLQSAMAKFSPFRGHYHQAMVNTMEFQGHWLRMAHFIDAITKAPKNMSVKDVMNWAADETRKWHPDGIDLTKAEKQLRLLLPFYSWSRKAIPLMLEGILMHPGKITMPAKALYGIQKGENLPGVSISNPFPTDQMFPQWIKDTGSGPIARASMGGPLGWLAGIARQGTPKSNEGNTNPYAIVNPLQNPLQDTLANFTQAHPTPAKGQPPDILSNLGPLGGIVGGLANALNPVVKTPAELLAGKQFGTNIPITDPNAYIGQQIPVWAQIQNMTNMGPFGPTKRGVNEGMGNNEALLNYLTSANLRGTGPFIKSAGIEANGGKMPTPVNPVSGQMKATNTLMREWALQQGYRTLSGKVPTGNWKIPSYVRSAYLKSQAGK
jgi:hypothetical protein